MYGISVYLPNVGKYTSGTRKEQGLFVELLEGPTIPFGNLTELAAYFQHEC